MNDPMRLTGILSGLVILVCCSLMIPAAFEIHGLAGLAVFIAATLGAFMLLGAILSPQRELIEIATQEDDT